VAVNQVWTGRSAEGPAGPALGEVGQSYPAAVVTHRPGGTAGTAPGTAR